MVSDMPRSIHDERAKLTAILDDYETGGTGQCDDERGEWNPETTAERIESVRRRIADIDRKLARPRGT